MLSKSDTASLRQPVGLEQQLLKDNEMDSEVGQSMLQLLKVMMVTATLLLQTPIESQQSVVTVMQLNVLIPILQDMHSASLCSRHLALSVLSYSKVVKMPAPCCPVLLQPSRQHKAFVKHCVLPRLWSTCTKPQLQIWNAQWCCMLEHLQLRTFAPSHVQLDRPHTVKLSM